MEALENI